MWSDCLFCEWYKLCGGISDHSASFVFGVRYVRDCLCLFCVWCMMRCVVMDQSVYFVCAITFVGERVVRVSVKCVVLDV